MFEGWYLEKYRNLNNLFKVIWLSGGVGVIIEYIYV